jgi:hypothetical protein
MTEKKTWREKRADAKDLPRVQPLEGGMRERYGEGTILLPAPMEVDELMRAVAPGRVTTINHLREHLARKHGATVTCPIVAGIHARVCAAAAGEEEDEGAEDVTPYWRTLKTGGELNPKYPGGVEGQRIRLEAEGHRVLVKGKRYVVEDHESRLHDLS